MKRTVLSILWSLVFCHLSSQNISDHIFAVVLSGGHNKLTNYERYWNDCAFLYSTLRQTYRIPQQVTLLNTSSLPCQMPFFLVAENKNTGEHTPCGNTFVDIEGRSATTLRLPFRLPEGHYQLQAAADEGGQNLLGSVQLTIAPLRKLNFHAELSLDMLSTVNNQRFLYGNLLQGYVSVQNQDEPYYGANGGTADDDGVVLWLEDADSHRCLFSQHLASELGAMCSVTAHFSNDPSSYAAGNYVLKVGYGTPTGLQPIDSLTFVRRSATSTYWTADISKRHVEKNHFYCLHRDAVVVCHGRQYSRP